MFKVLKDFKGSPDGMAVIEYKAGEEVDLVPALAEVAVKEKWVKPVPKTKTKAELDAEAAAKQLAEEQAKQLASQEAEAAALRGLYGSSVQPSIIVLANGSEIQLGELVSAAFEASGLTGVAWNDLPEADREQRLVDQLQILNQPAPMA